MKYLHTLILGKSVFCGDEEKKNELTMKSETVSHSMTR